MLTVGTNSCHSNLLNMEENSFENLSKLQSNDILDATVTALTTGDLSYLAKEELRYTIQARRLATGQRELTVGFSEPIKYELTEEEQTKIIKKREQNRLAAQRFRQRRRQNRAVLTKQIQILESENSTKMAEVERLREERATLQSLLHNHLSVCPGINAF